MAAFRIIVALCIYLTAVVSEEDPAPPGYIPLGLGKGHGTGSTGNCKFEFNVPDKAGMCSSGNSALDAKIKELKSDLDRTRLQYVSQNSIIQDQISKVQNNVNGYGSQINDLYNHMRQVEASVHNQPSSQGSGAMADLQKHLQTVKDNFNNALRDLENKLFNVSTGYQKEAIEQSKVNAALEVQVKEQGHKVEIAQKDVKDLLKRVGDLESGGSTVRAGSGNVSPGVLKNVQDRLKNFDERIKMYDQLQQQQFSALQLKSNAAFLKISNQSHQINDISVEASAIQFRVDDLRKKAEKTANDFDHFKTVNEPKIAGFETDIQDVKANAKYLQTQLKSVADKSMNADMLSHTGKMAISDLKIRMDLVTRSIKGVLDKLKAQSGTIQNLTTDLHSLESISASLKPTEIQTLENAMKSLQNTGSLGSVTQDQLKHVEQEIQSLNKLVADLNTKTAPIAVPTLPHHVPTTAGIATDVPPSTKPPIVFPTLKPNKQTTKTPFVAPTPKPHFGPVSLIPIPTLPPKAPGMQPTGGFAIPTLRPRSDKK